MPYAAELQFAIQAVRHASQLAIGVQAALTDEDAVAKADRSPVTVADLGVQALISYALQRAYPNDPLMGEESSGGFHSDAGKIVIEKVTDNVTRLQPEIGRDEVIPLIDRAAHSGGGTDRFWTLDPIDGTKGFLRRQQYAIALALIEDGQVVAGVLGCPNLSPNGNSPDAKAGCLLAASKGDGAKMLALCEETTGAIQTRKQSDTSGAIVCESVESGHSNHSASSQVTELLGITADPVRIDSQCKYAVVARGDADIYLRLPTRPGYEERIWDHAAGAIIVREAGGRVTDVRGAALDFSRGATLCNNSGVIATSGDIHDEVVEAVGRVLK